MSNLANSIEKTLTFEQALAELEQVVRGLEDGQVGLEQALDGYEKGVGLLKHCHQLLLKVEERIRLLTGVDDKGQPVTQPLAPEAVDNPLESRLQAERPAEAGTPTHRPRKKAGETEQTMERSFFG